MAYLDLALHGDDVRFKNPFPPARVAAGQATDLNLREWSVAYLARNDSLSSIRPQSRLGRVFRAIFGIKLPNPLSDSRLEALRRIAVMSWRFGYNVAPSEISEFLAAGFSELQYEALLKRIHAERSMLRGSLA